MQTAKVTADDGSNNDYFGNSLDISGDVIVVGAYLDDDNGSGSGSAYVIEKNGTSGQWEQVEKFTAYDGAESDRFGRDVGISDGVIVVGAYYDGDDGDRSGSAYIIN